MSSISFFEQVVVNIIKKTKSDMNWLPRFHKKKKKQKQKKTSTFKCVFAQNVHIFGV